MYVVVPVLRRREGYVDAILAIATISRNVLSRPGVSIVCFELRYTAQESQVYQTIRDSLTFIV